MAKIAPALVMAAFLLSACGGGDTLEESSRAESTESPPTSTPDAADVAIAEQSLLTLEDFSLGWEAQPPDSDESELDKQKIAECVGVDYDEMYDDSIAKAESKTFISPEDVDVDHEVGIAADEEWMKNAFELTSGDEFRGCVAEEMQAMLVEQFEAEDEEVELGDVTVNELGFGSYGDGSTALRVTIPFTTQGFSLEASLDIVAVRVGRAQSVVMVSSVGSGLSVDELGVFVELAVNRLQEGLATA